MRKAPALFAVVLSALFALPSVQAAGNVTVTVDDEDSLRITGDDLANCIVIDGGGNSGEYSVAGCDSTTVNGDSGVSVDGVDNDFKISMGKGNDRVTLSDGDNNLVPDDLEITTGPGDDTVTLTNFRIGDDLRVATGTGNDTLTLDSVSAEDSVKIDMGSGTDVVCAGPCPS